LNNTARVRHPLDGMFRPKSVAIVGATEKSRWARMAVRNLDASGFTGKVFMVNRLGGEAFGHKAYASCVAIGQAVDVALLLIPAAALAEMFEDLAAAGIRNAVILSSGLAEAGPDGARLQEALHDKAARLDITVVGPNCTGYVNFGGNAAMYAGTLRLPPLPGEIAIIAQSGAVVGSAHHFAAQQGIGLSAIVGTGNELNLELEAVVDYFLDDPATKVIGFFAETSRNPEVFKAAARKARAVGKPLVALKVGRSDVTATAAQVHTGALVGDDRVFDAVCKQYGVVRVRSIDQLVVTADAMSKIGRVSGKRVAIVSISGGLSEISADIAHDENMTLAVLSDDTRIKLRAFLPSFATVNNPLDLTGAATTEFDIHEKTIEVLGRAPEVDLLLYIFEVPRDADDATAFAEASLQAIGRGFAKIDKAAVLIPYTMKTVGPSSLALIRENRLPYVSGGMEIGMPAVSRALEFAEGRSRERRGAESARASSARVPETLPRSEYQAQRFLADHGVPVVPTTLVRSSEEALAAAAKIGDRIVVKIASEDIAHKSDIGGVKINLAPEEAGRAFDEVVASARRLRPDAKIDGALVSAMRGEGVELLVGVTRDPQWGLVLAIGLGGVFVEILGDTSLRLLPVTEEDVVEMLGELRGGRMLAGYRNTPVVNIGELARVIKKISEAALAAGPSLGTLEVNPLLASGDRIEALDALMVAK
jgi:acetate---CoA ligase (ADP-forming)